MKNKCEVVCGYVIIRKAGCRMKYIAILRGINISGKNKIAMPKLKSVLGESEFKNVVTYLILCVKKTKCQGLCLVLY